MPSAEITSAATILLLNLLFISLQFIFVSKNIKKLVNLFEEANAITRNNNAYEKHKEESIKSYFERMLQSCQKIIDTANDQNAIFVGNCRMSYEPCFNHIHFYDLHANQEDKILFVNGLFEIYDLEKQSPRQTYYFSDRLKKGNGNFSDALIWGCEHLLSVASKKLDAEMKLARLSLLYCQWQYDPKQVEHLEILEDLNISRKIMSDNRSEVISEYRKEIWNNDDYKITLVSILRDGGFLDDSET